MLSVLFAPHPTSTLGSFTLATHGVLFALGAVVGSLVAFLLARRLKLPTENLLGAVVLIFGVGLLCARLGYVVTYVDPGVTWRNWYEYWQGGLVSYWGIAGGLLMGWLLVYRLPTLTRWRWLDVTVIAGLAAWSVGRWGNYWAVESYGLQSSFWGLCYGRIPIQLFESVVCALLALVGYFLVLKKPKRPGLVGLLLLTSYFATRAGIDLWWGSIPRYSSSELSLVLTFGCFLLLYVHHEKQ